MTDTIAKSTRIPVEAIAEICHEANRAYCKALGDRSQAQWSMAPDWQRESAIKGVMSALGGGGPKESHEGWLREKRENGWVYGPVKDPDAKTHPCMVEYDQLPPEQQLKDALFVGIVRMFIGPFGFNAQGPTS